MLLKYFYDQALAHASYLVGCQQSGVAVVVDPGRDIDQYVEAAEQEGLQLTAVAETHIHADYVSGARELAERVGAKLYVSNEGPPEWKYQYLSDYDSQLLTDGDTFSIGRIQFQVMHTPGHTPESISFLVTDQGGGADRPMGIFTGDFVFVGSIGRPDLLEEAAAVKGSAREGAQQLFHSAERFKQLPDFLQVWPAHGAGSACGKGLGAIPSSTVGYENLFNPALQYDDEEAFVQYILADQPEVPKYFAVMKRVNKEGPKVLGESALPEWLDAAQLKSVPDDAAVIDVSPSKRFAESHVPGSVNIPVPMLGNWAGWLIDYSKPVYLICARSQLSEAARVLHKIGVDTIAGAVDVETARREGLATESYRSASPTEVAGRIQSGEVHVVDVRSGAEWTEGHIPQAEHHFLGHLPDQLGEIPGDKPLVTQCGSGARSAIAASVLEGAGFDVINLSGGYREWVAADLPRVKETEKAGSAANA